MQRILSALLAVVFLTPAFATQPVVPTTTLTAETGNNTSTPGSFATTTNGDLGASNVSKVPIRSLLKAGMPTAVFAHVLPWWGSSSHINIGYSSKDPAQAQRQVADMISRGIDGAVVDWYGPTSFEDAGFKTFLAAAEARPGFTVVNEIEHGSVLWDSCYPGCSVTTAVIQLATYVAQTFFSSTAYYRINGRPVLMEFAMETLPAAVDWNAVAAAVPGNPLFVHRNPTGFAIAQSSGSYGWMQPETTPTARYDGSAYLDYFYKIAAVYPAESTWGSVYKGFDDTLASWAPPGGRHIYQNCGQTWLTGFAEANKWYSAAKPLPFVQLVTWNDYEEGTELESGIDNCVAVAASVTGTLLNWQLSSGSESTIDHYTAFISPDGSKLMPLGDFPAGVHSLDLSTFAFDPGSYQLLVKAVGKPSIRNQMSNAAAWSIASPPPPVPGLVLATTPASLSLSRGQSGSYTVSVIQQNLAGPVTLACSGAPAGATCTVTPAQIPAGAGATTVTVGISTAQVTSRSGSWAWPLQFGAMGLAGLVFATVPRRRKSLSRAGVLAVLLAITLTGCGGAGLSTTSIPSTAASSLTSTGSGSTPQTPPATTPAPAPTPTPTPAPTPTPSPAPAPLPASGSYTITVSASSGTMQSSTTATLVIH